MILLLAWSTTCLLWRNHLFIESGILERLKKSDPDFIGPWKLINRLGSGGMSVVYQASKNERTSVALKVIRSQYLDNQVDRSRIEREISTLTQIKSNFVCQIIDSDITEDFAWIATEYINGPDLKTKVNLDGPYAEDDWYLLSKGLLEGLKAIHEYGVVHRDIKPTNILISSAGPKIIDFGIAQSSEATSLTSTGLIAGSPAWLSPEQINGDKVTYSSDIFSAGAVLNFAVSGISPWGDNTKITKDVIYNRILQKQPDLSSLSILQKSLVQQMMEKTPKSRPSADQALIYLNDKWSQEAKLKKQFEEEEKQREKEDKQKREEQLVKRRKNRQRLKKVILEPILMRRKILSLALASVFILASTGTYAFTSYSSKTGIFQFMAESDSIEIETPEEIIAQPQPTSASPSAPEMSVSPTPSQTVSVKPSENVSISSKTKSELLICRTISQIARTQTQCFKTSETTILTVENKYGDCPILNANNGTCDVGTVVIVPTARGSVIKPCSPGGDIKYSVNGSSGGLIGGGEPSSLRNQDCADKSNNGFPYVLNGFPPLSFLKDNSITESRYLLPEIGTEVVDTYEIKEVKSSSTSKNVSTTPNIVGKNIDLNKTKMCLTINQHSKSDTTCFKEIPVIKQPDYTSRRGITPFSEEKYLFLYAPWSKSNIYGCTRISYTVTGQSYLNGDLFFNDWMTGTMDRSSENATTNKFCEKMGGFDYAVTFTNPIWNMPYFNVAAFDKDKSLPQSYEIIQNYGDYKISFIYTWQKR
jgi:serine/threonine protein kinase